MRSCRRLFALVTLLLAPGLAHADADQPRAAQPYFARKLDEARARFARAGRRAAAVVAVQDAADLWDVLDDRAPLAAFFDQAAADPKAAPEARAWATYERSLLAEHAGKAADAAALRAQLGLLERFWVVGPFDDEGRTGQAAVFGPEKQLLTPPDPAISYDGKERAVSWRRLPPIAVGGRVAFDAILRPDTNVTAYVTTMVRVAGAKGPTRAALRLGTGGAVKAWVNGAQVLARDVYRPPHFDQEAAAVELRPGWNRVTIKVSALEGPWALYARLSRPDGAPLASLEQSAEPSTFAEGAHKPAKAARFAVADVEQELRARTRAAPRDPEAWRELGRYLHHATPDDPEARTAAVALTRAAQLEPQPATFLELALAEPDADDRRRALEAGLHDRASALPGDRAPLYSVLGQLYQEARRERRAEELWLQGARDEAGYWPLTVHLAELAAERGVPSRAAQMLATLAAAHPALRVWRAQAALAIRRGRRAEAQALYERITAVERDDSEGLHELYDFARSRGDTKTALAYADRIAAVRPDILQTALDRADVLEADGDGSGAHQALQAGLALAPEETRLLERDGRLLHRLGRDDEALVALERALELRPQNPELRQYVHALAHEERGGDLPRAWAVDVPALIAHAPKVDKQQDRARVLYDSTVTRVHPNGLSESYTQRVVEILDDRGAREEGSADIRYTPDTQSVEVRAARVYKRSGEIVEASASAERDVSEPWYGLYYDVKSQSIQFDALQPGDVVDVEYVVSDVARRNMFADYFGDLHMLQEDLPRLATRYVVIAPKTRTLYFNRPKLADLLRDEQQHGDETVYTFAARNVPKVEAEPGMPGFTDVAAYLHVSTYKTWDEVATWYRGLVAEQLQSSRQIHEAVMNAVKSAGDERARIRAVYDLVVQKTRYVGLEFGIHGYQPYRTTQVFARKFGDCKDKASLLVVMLREIGVEASLVLARTRRGGDLDAEPASLAPFDHAIVYVPKYDLFLDGTAEFSGSAELPAQDQDIPVLIVAQGKLGRTPVLPAADNRVATTSAVKLAADGSAKVDETVSVAGEVAHEWREHYQSPGERLERFGKAWAGKHPGGRVTAVEMPGIGDLERPVEVRAKAELPDWARLESDGGKPQLVMPAAGREPDMQRSYARLSSRKYDLVLGFPWRQEDRVTVTLPPGMSVKRLPEARTLTSPFGSFTLGAKQSGDTVEVTAALEVSRHRIAREDYGAFRRFCADVDAALGQDLVVGQ